MGGSWEVQIRELYYLSLMDALDFHEFESLSLLKHDSISVYICIFIYSNTTSVAM